MDAAREWLIEANDLGRVYGNSEEIRALDGVDLRVKHGELLAIMGPSGSGKSTLLNVLGALDKPTRGSVFIGGQDVSKIENKASFRANTVGFIFQLHNLLPTLTALENLEVPMAGRLTASERRARAEELLELVGLSDRQGHLPNQLSGGQRQRVAVARALANSPPLVLADEPTGNLDSTAGQDLMDLIRDLNLSQGVTFIIVTHDLAVARETNRILVMDDGKIVREDEVGSPLEEDLKVWAHTELGRRIVSGAEGKLEGFDISDEQMEEIRSLLMHAGGSS
ncbi:MAG: ABC transporter ATP-binding protein [Anaerolineales bacterium]|nr:ABC transporter ATP-binding protein [Anaerolineales bacterium]